MCSSATGPLWDLYISTSSEVGTYLEQNSESHLGGVAHAEYLPQYIKTGTYKQLVKCFIIQSNPTYLQSGKNAREKPKSAPEDELKSFLKGRGCLFSVR